jgi:hypothetical protein
MLSLAARSCSAKMSRYRRPYLAVIRVDQLERVVQALSLYGEMSTQTASMMKAHRFLSYPKDLDATKLQIVSGVGCRLDTAPAPPMTTARAAAVPASSVLADNQRKSAMVRGLRLQRKRTQCLLAMSALHRQTRLMMPSSLTCAHLACRKRFDIRRRVASFPFPRWAMPRARPYSAASAWVSRDTLRPFTTSSLSH